MKTRRWMAGVVLATWGLTSGAFAQSDADVFTLGVRGPDAVAAKAGELASADYEITLTHDGLGVGAQAWSFGVIGVDADIVSITTEGTNAAALFDGGFQRSELTDGEGNRGAISAMTLCQGCPATLPPNETSSIAVIGLSVPVGLEDSVAGIEFAEGLVGAGQPVQIVVTQEGFTIEPDLAAKGIEVLALPDCCAPGLNYAFSGQRVQSPDPLLPTDSDPACLGNTTVLVNEVSPGEIGRGKVFVNVSSNVEGDGVQGWSVGVAVDGFRVVEDSVSLDDTAGAPMPDGLYDNGFNKTQRIDPGENEGQEGAVSAVVLCFGCPTTLPLVGTESILQFEVETLVPVPEEGAIDGVCRVEADLLGNGQPVRNVLTILGASIPACNTRFVSASIRFAPVENRPFRRGDANDDGKNNIADPIWILNELFRDGPRSPCDRAADANSDGTVDLADVSFEVTYLFERGEAPGDPGPFACGPSPTTDDGLSCADFTSCE